MDPSPPYVPLWVKSSGSFLEGASHPEELVERAAGMRLPGLALTDRDGLYSATRAHVAVQRLARAPDTILGTSAAPAAPKLLLGAQVSVSGIPS
ncbi:MAG: PHP domain-containing protein [Nannocystaceae bacterium]